MSNNYTTVSVRPEHKSAIDEAQEALADDLGFEPSKGQTVVHACLAIAEGRGGTPEGDE